MFNSATQFLGYPLEVERRAFQRSMNIIVRPNGLIKVTTNKTVREKYILRFLEDNKSWLEKTQSNFLELRSKYPVKQFITDEKFMFLGKNRSLVFKPSAKKRLHFQLLDEQIVAHLPNIDWREVIPFQPQKHLRPLMLKFYQRQGKMILQSRVEIYSEIMKLYPSKLTFRSQKTRWGSCGSNGTVSLNWKLVAAPLEIIDYVVVHELAHLRHQDHSQIFWALVERYSPYWKSYRKWLRDNQYEFDFLAKTPELYFTPKD